MTTKKTSPETDAHYQLEVERIKAELTAKRKKEEAIENSYRVQATQLAMATQADIAREPLLQRMQQRVRRHEQGQAPYSSEFVEYSPQVKTTEQMVPPGAERSFSVGLDEVEFYKGLGWQIAKPSPISSVRWS